MPFEYYFQTSWLKFSKKMQGRGIRMQEKRKGGQVESERAKEFEKP